VRKTFVVDLDPLPATFVPTRESLRALACYVISPARKARTGHISLEPSGHGLGTPPFGDGTRIAVCGARLLFGGESIAITTLRAASTFIGVELSGDPGVGHDLPPFAPDGDLAVDASASLALGNWYAFAAMCLDALRNTVSIGTVSAAQIWPEHFDCAVTVDLVGGSRVNVGMSPGDARHPDPYAYVAPPDVSQLSGEFWNAPFGALLGYPELRESETPIDAVLRFTNRGLGLLASTDPVAT
jgi:hypothetical protein